MSMRGLPRKRGRPCKAARLARDVPIKRPYHRKKGLGLDIGNEAARWTNLKEGNGLASDEEVAKYLLDLWDIPKRNKKENSLVLGPATVRDFESFQTRTKKSADEIIRFFLRLDIEPGQSIISANESVCRVFEGVRSRNNVRSNDLMTTLLEVHAKHTKWCGHDKPRPADPNVIAVGPGVGNAFEALRVKQNMRPNDLVLMLLEVHAKHTKFCGEKPRPELEKTVRRALREEMLQLIDSGILIGTSHSVNRSDVSHTGDGGHVMQGNLLDGSMIMSNKDLSSPDSAKKRSRKSLPQRVVIEQEHPVESDMDESLMMGVTTEIDSGENRSKHTSTIDMTGDSEIEYNYVMSTSTVSILPSATSRPCGGPGDMQSRSRMDGTYDSTEETDTVTDPATADTKLDTAAGHEDQYMGSSTESAIDPASLEKEGFVKNADGQFVCSLCDYKSAVISRIKRHYSLHEKKFKCSQCERSFTEKHKLKDHMKSKHANKSQIKCEACPRNFKSKGGLRFHRRTWHPNDFEFWCEFCAIGFNNFMFYETHMNRHGALDEYRCNQCTKRFPSLVLLSIHMTVCTSGEGRQQDRVNCDKCSSSFQSAADLKDHLIKGRCNTTRFRCGCGSEFKWRAMFDNHRAMCEHSGIDTGCVEVKVEDGLANIAIVNVESMAHDIPDYRDAEEKSTNVDFDESSNSIQVTNMESGEQFVYDLTGEGETDLEPKSDNPHTSHFMVCKFCNYKTDKLPHMRRHEMIHNVKKYKCSECPKSFSEKERLKTHQNAKHKGSSRYKCDKCSRTFLSKGGIMYHQQTKHNNSYKYKCETCDKGFNTIQHYLGHKNTHSGVRPFVCEKCNIGFAYPSVLTSHKRVCKGKIDGVDMNGRLDLYPCKECKEKFAMFSALQQHLQDAHGAPGRNRYLCECGSDFELRALYDLHKTTCTFTDKSVDVIMESICNESIEVTSLGERDRALEEEFKQLSPEKFNAIISNQPVFPL